MSQRLNVQNGRRDVECWTFEGELNRVVVWSFLGMMGDAKVEEAVVAVFAAIGNLKQHTAKDQILDALPERAVNSVTAALGANVRMMTMRGFVHGKLLDRGSYNTTSRFGKGRGSS
jgi:hypothetical protein